MDKINQNKINNISLKGVGQKAEKGVKMMDELIKNMVKELHSSAKSAPEYSIYEDFSALKTSFLNPDKSICSKGFILKIYQPKGETDKTQRAMDIIAYKDGTDYVASRMIAFGDMDAMVRKLEDKNIVKELKKAMYELSDKLEDI